MLIHCSVNRHKHTCARAHVHHREACGRRRVVVIPAKILTLPPASQKQRRASIFSPHYFFKEHIWVHGWKCWLTFAARSVRDRINNGGAAAATAAAAAAAAFHSIGPPREIVVATRMKMLSFTQGYMERNLMCAPPSSVPILRNSWSISAREGARGWLSSSRDRTRTRFAPSPLPRDPFTACAVWLLDLLYYAYTKHIGSRAEVVDAKFFDAGNSIPYRLWNKNCDGGRCRNIYSAFEAAREGPCEVRGENVFTRLDRCDAIQGTTAESEHDEGTDS